MPGDYRLSKMLACPRCDKSPLDEKDGEYHCSACKVVFPNVGGIPWLFAEPDAALGEWRNRLHFALQQLAQDAKRFKSELAKKTLSNLTRRRLRQQLAATESHRNSLSEFLAPVGIQSMQASYTSYLALRTRLPPGQGLNTYYSNVHRDWSWGDEENDASLAQIRKVLRDDDAIGDTLVLGAGAGRLAYDVHMQMVSHSPPCLRRLWDLPLRQLLQGRSEAPSSRPLPSACEPRPP